MVERSQFQSRDINGKIQKGKKRKEKEKGEKEKKGCKNYSKTKEASYIIKHSKLCMLNQEIQIKTIEGFKTQIIFMYSFKMKQLVRFVIQTFSDKTCGMYLLFFHSSLHTHQSTIHLMVNHLLCHNTVKKPLSKTEKKIEASLHP